MPLAPGSAGVPPAEECEAAAGCHLGRYVYTKKISDNSVAWRSLFFAFCIPPVVAFWLRGGPDSATVDHGVVLETHRIMFYVFLVSGTLLFLHLVSKGLALKRERPATRLHVFEDSVIVAQNKVLVQYPWAILDVEALPGTVRLYRGGELLMAFSDPDPHMFVTIARRAGAQDGHS